jgi:aminopeptidase N
MMRAPFDPPWKQNEKRNVVTEWDLLPDSSARGTIAASPDGFFVADETAFPLWQTPNGVFAVGGENPNKELLTVFAPPDFRVLAPGKPLKRAADGNYAAWRFSIDPNSDYLPYVVAGRYREKVIQSRQGVVQFWTFQPMDGSAAQRAAEWLSSSMKALTEFFGPSSKGKAAVRIAEAPAELPAEFGVLGDPGGASFPEGVLLDPRAFQQGIASEAVLQLAEYELARTWFGWRVRPRPEAQILIGRGVGLFGMVIAAEGRGQDQRRRMVASLMDRYDEARAIAPDKRLMESPVGYSRAEQISTGYRAALFFVALEDLCGHDNLRTALRDIIRARAGSDTGYEELRAAAESASGKDLAEMFRTWLVQPGIPDDFRARYQKTTVARLQN